MPRLAVRVGRRGRLDARDRAVEVLDRQRAQVRRGPFEGVVQQTAIASSDSSEKKADFQ